MRIAKILYGTTVEGPGKRVAIWFQGCSIKCDQCINPELQDPSQGEEMSADGIADNIRQSGLNKITILGGEPLDQAPAVMELVYKIRLRVPSATFMLFTGYETAVAKKKLGPIIWPVIDVLVTGPYDKSRPDRRKWIGSTNQEIIRNTMAAVKYKWPMKQGFELEFSHDETGAYCNGL